MQQRVFFRGPMLVTLDPPGVEAADILVVDGRIARKGWRFQPPADAEIIDARGRILFPGLVNAHVRLDAAYARTLPFATFGADEIAKVQAALTEETLIAAAFSTAIEAARAGCTALFCFHDAPGFVRGALGRIRDVMATIGLRMSAACGVNDRMTEAARAEALAESADAAALGSGGRAAFTRATVVYSPSAAELAGTPPAAISAFGPDAALGTDWARPDIFEEARLAAARSRAAGTPASPQDVVALLVAGHRLASAVFGTPMGSFEPGAAADLVVLDYRAPTPLNAETVPHHVASGFSASCVQHVMVDGRFIVRDRAVVNVDVRNLFRQTQRGALDLWQRIRSEDFPGLNTPTHPETMGASPAEAPPPPLPRSVYEIDLEFEPLDRPAVAPWLVCPQPAESEATAAAAPVAPRIPAPAKAPRADAPKSDPRGSFGAGI